VTRMIDQFGIITVVDIKCFLFKNILN